MYPKAWDVEETFGSVEGSLAGYWGATRRLTLAARVGGKQIWGRYPWHESAFLGGSDNVRGLRPQPLRRRHVLFANVEARFGLGATGIILPARWGLLALADTGRVWLDGEESDKWRTGLRRRPLGAAADLNITFYGAIVKGVARRA